MSKYISIITPTYNHEKYIGECIESVLNQTHENWEMIIVDDASTDNTVNIVEKYADSDSRIKIIVHDWNYGPFRLKDTYNEALKISKGEYIAILEGDDYWPDYKLEEQLKLFDEKDIILNWGDCTVVRWDGKPISYYKANIKDNRIFNNPIGSILSIFANLENPIWAQTVIIKKDVLKRIGGFQGTEYLPLVDYPTWVVLSLDGQFSYINKNLGYWRRHRTAVTLNYGKELRILKGYSKFFVEFVNRYMHKLDKLGVQFDISDIMEQHNKILEEMKKRERYYRACFFLSANDFKNARREFCSVLKQKEIPVKYKACSALGIFSSYLKVDLIKYIRDVIIKLK